MIQDLTNTTLDNRYRFDALIGEGTFARVYRIHDMRRGVELAAKVLRADIAHEPSFLERFRREAQVLEKLQHPHIVRYYGTVETEGVVFMLLDYIPGYTLQTLLYRRREPLNISDALQIMKPLCTALTYAHGEGIIHRDIKPANVLIGDNGQTYITDFGIARLLNEASTLTQDTSIGTPLYMAPEQILGKEITLAADIYAVGVLLYQMFTGKVPFSGKDPQAIGTTVSDRVAYEHLNLPPAPPREHNPDLSKAVQDVILHCLRKEPTARFVSAIAVYDALAEAVGATPAEMNPVVLDRKPVPPSSTLPEWSKVVQKVQAEESTDEAPADGYNQADQPAIESPESIPKTIQSGRVLEEPVARPTMIHVPADQGDKRETQPHAKVPPPVYDAPPYQSQSAQQTYNPPRPSRRAGSGGQGAIVGGIMLGIIAALIVVCLGVGLYLYATGQFGGAEKDKDSDSQAPTPTANIQLTATALIQQNVPSTGGNSATTSNANTPANTQVASNNNPSTGGRDGDFAYSAVKDGDFDIFRGNINGGEVVQLTDSSQNETGASYSPDGSQIAYYAYPGQSAADIWVMNEDGSNPRNLTNSSANERVVNWSPDGKNLAYHSNADGDYDIYIYNLETGESRNLTRSPHNDLGPSWSPDGSQIAFHSDEDNNFNEIFIINVDGSEREQVTNGQWSAAFATWATDGSRLVFHAITGTAYELYTIRPDGTGLEDLFPQPNNERHADVASDGETIIYMSGADNNPIIKITNFSTGETRQILSGGWYPDWRP